MAQHQRATQIQTPLLKCHRRFSKNASVLSLTHDERSHGTHRQRLGEPPALAGNLVRCGAPTSRSGRLL